MQHTIIKYQNLKKIFPNATDFKQIFGIIDSSNLKESIFPFYKAVHFLVLKVAFVAGIHSVRSVGGHLH
jgi:hypothetical protein